MAELATMARPYANAAFDVAKRDNDLGTWSKALAYLATAAGNDTVRTLLEAPDMEAPVKAQKLIDVCGDALDDRTKRFVQVLAGNKRLPLIGEIFDQFEALRAAEEHQIDVEVVSAMPLTDDQQSTLAAALKKKFEREVNMTHSVDATLIGGAVIRAGDTVIDGSLSGKLKKLAENVLR